MSIPKIIHQTYRDQNLPSDIQEVVNTLKMNNPDWDYRFYNDTDIEHYIQKNFSSEVLEAYQSINSVYGAARADLFRYLVLWNEGGVYLDIKSSCMHSLSEVFKDEDKFLITQWQNDIGQNFEGAGIYKSLNALGEHQGEYQQWVLASERFSPIMKAVIDAVISNINSYTPWKYGLNSYGKNGVLMVTGPIAYTKAVYPFKYAEGVRYERYDKNLGFIYNALPQNHTQVLRKHYARYKQAIIRRNLSLNLIYSFYILMLRVSKNILRVVRKQDL